MRKMTRRQFATGLVGAAAVVTLTEDMALQDVHIGLGSVAPTLITSRSVP